MPFGDRRFDLGVNIAWLHSANGHDLGYNPYFAGPAPHPDWGVAWSEDLVRAYFADLASCGFTVVRFWAFEKLEGLVFDPRQFDPRAIVARVDGNGRTIIRDNPPSYEQYNIPLVTGLQEGFCNNTQTLMRCAAAYHLDVYWTILTAGNYFFDPTVHHAWGLRRLLEDRLCRASFLRHACLPFLELLRPFRQNIYAIDLINEPEGFSFRKRWGRRVPVDEVPEFALEYIQEASTALRDASGEFRLSVGFRSRDAIEANRAALEPHVDFFDFHCYSDHGVDRGPCAGKPTILGELGYRSPDGRFLPDDDQQHRHVHRLIGDAIDGGFRGCFLWRYSPRVSEVDGNNLLRDLAHDTLSITEAEFAQSFTDNAAAYWRPVRTAVEDRARQISALNGAV